MLNFKTPAVWAHQAMMTCFSLLDSFTVLEINSVCDYGFYFLSA